MVSLVSPDLGGMRRRRWDHSETGGRCGPGRVSFSCPCLRGKGGPYTPRGSTPRAGLPPAPGVPLERTLLRRAQTTGVRGPGTTQTQKTTHLPSTQKDPHLKEGHLDIKESSPRLCGGPFTS